MFPPRVVAVVGPTATGKSDWAIALAHEFKGEVVSVDSRQVYRGMDLGTGKVQGVADPSRPLFDMVPLVCDGIDHWLLDVADPVDDFTVVQYKTLCLQVLERDEAPLPILAGGTGLYLRAVLDGLSLPSAPPDAEVRSWDLGRLQTCLRSLDPAAEVDWMNPRRLMRAIEIVRATGRPLAVSRHAEPPPGRQLVLGIAMDIDEIRRRIALRLRHRLDAGLVDEVRGLLQQGVPAARLDGFGLEYRFVTRHVQGDLSYDAMAAQLETAIGQYARRQLTWFRKYGRVHWVHTMADAQQAVTDFLETGTHT